MNKIITILLLCLSLSVGAQTTYYVAATGGNNGNTGTSGSPWATLTYAVTAAGSGNIVYMQAGTHTINTTVNVPTGVSITGAGVTSIIQTTSLTAEWNAVLKLESSSQTNGNQNISFLYFKGNNAMAQAINVIGRNNVKIYNCKFDNIVWTGVGIKSANSGGEEANQEATDFSTGIEFYNNRMDNCAGSGSGWLRGALFVGGVSGMLIHHDTIICVDRPTTAGVPIKFWYWGGWHRGTKIYNCYLEKDNVREGGDYGFAIESLWNSGWEVYDNTIIGCIDPNDGIIRAPYDYSLWVHNNILGPTTRSGDFNGITLEFQQTNVIIENNVFRNNSPGLLFTVRSSTLSNIIIRKNLFYNLTNNGATQGGIVMLGGSGYRVTSMSIHNNTFHSNPSYPAGWGIIFDWDQTNYTVGTLDITNNIFTNFSQYWLEINKGDQVTLLNTRNNDYYNNGNSNAYNIYSGSPITHVNTNNKTVNPLFVSSTDLTLQVTSTLIDAGLNIGLPYNSTAPDIGYAEYFDGSPSSIPVTSIIVTGQGGATTISIKSGTLQLSAAILPVNADNKTVTWSRANGTGSCTISSSGLVTALTDGTVTARATANDGSGVYGELIITISNQTEISTGEKFVKGSNGRFLKSGNQLIKK